MSRGLRYIIVLNFVKIGESCWNFMIFQFFKMAAGRHLGFSNSINLKGQRVVEVHVHGASPCQIWSKSVKRLWRYHIFSIFQDGGRPPSWICLPHFWTTNEAYMVVFICVQNLVGIHAVVAIIWIWIFRMFGLKMPIHATKITVLRDIYQQNPQKAYPCMERRHRLPTLVHRCGLCACRWDQKRQRKKSFSCKLAISPNHLHRTSKIPFGRWVVFQQ